ncbi:hypothetical protein ABT173_11540 [Streptomyces sp. NPDC001795]|uniref:hypothetical protein n=1 Tax=Streptomyces sp. NPDC001795 TaxID=3154525 RepID=UPI003327DD88
MMRRAAVGGRSAVDRRTPAKAVRHTHPWRMNTEEDVVGIKERLAGLPANLVILVGVVAFIGAAVAGGTGALAGFAVAIAITSGCIGWLAWDGWTRWRRERAQQQ